MGVLYDPVAQYLGRVLHVSDITHLEARLKHTIALHKLLKCVANWVASTTNPG